MSTTGVSFMVNLLNSSVVIVIIELLQPDALTVVEVSIFTFSVV